MLELDPPRKASEEQEVEFAAAIFVFIVLCTIATAIGLSVLGAAAWIIFKIYSIF